MYEEAGAYKYFCVGVSLSLCLVVFWHHKPKLQWYFGKFSFFSAILELLVLCSGIMAIVSVTSGAI